MVQEQASRVGRRLSAILAADVAGYSRLMGLDEVGTARVLREHRAVSDALVAKHAGRIVKTTGDGLLLEFASVVDAVECAVAIQAVMAQRNEDVPQDRRMLFRIGINLGDVLIEGDDILGDGVNVAARLEGIAEPGGICISASAHDQVRGKVAVEFTDLGELELKNIARSIRVYAVVADESETSAHAEPPISATKSLPRHLSIVVLPFANIGGDPEQEYFVDGVTESLTTDLSRMVGSFVIGRNTAFSYKGKQVDLKRVGRELGVRYALEGSVQRSGNRMRINTQLIDTETGNHLWAERFDKPVADLFDMQDEIISRIAGSLNAQLIAAEARRAERAPHPNSLDLYFQGLACANQGWTPDHLAKARGFFDRALILDPDNIEAVVGTAIADAMSGSGHMTDERTKRFAAAEGALSKALQLVPDHALAHMYMGFVQISTNRATLGIAECRQALTLDRNLAMAHGFIGLAKYFIGRGEETQGHILEALRLSPRDTNHNVWMTWAGLAKLALGADKDAIERFRHAIELNRNTVPPHFFLAAALALTGAADDARSMAQAGLALDPAYTIRRYRAGAATDNPTYLSQRERIYEGMRMAGVPEG
jgi:TolB-like protein/class 3 adenylate cyclase/tetratricopeptide (TPR) repeat protein